MRTLLEFIARVALVLYALFAFGVFFSIRGLVQARRARRVAMFGLEREEAARTRKRSLNTILTLIVLGGVVYFIKNIIMPNMDELPVEPTPTSVAFVSPDTPAN